MPRKDLAFKDELLKHLFVQLFIQFRNIHKPLDTSRPSRHTRKKYVYCKVKINSLRSIGYFHLPILSSCKNIALKTTQTDISSTFIAQNVVEFRLMKDEWEIQNIRCFTRVTMLGHFQMPPPLH